MPYLKILYILHCSIRDVYPIVSVLERERERENRLKKQCDSVSGVFSHYCCNCMVTPCTFLCPPARPFNINQLINSPSLSSLITLYQQLRELSPNHRRLFFELHNRMDIYGLPSNNTTTQDLFRIDDLLDFSNDELFTSSSSAATANTTAIASDTDHLLQAQHQSFDSFNPSSDFTGDLCVPSDDVAELEWLSQFVDDSCMDFPANSLAGTIVRSDTSLSGRGRSKRSKATNSAANTTTWNWTSSESESGNSKQKRENHRQSSPIPEGGVRRCTHCASEKTPQWRTGPLGPKTLCNACGVRYKSGRLVPEYRPASSPTFVLTQHSNSHRKVLELRRQKELLRQQQLQQQQQQEEGQGQIYRHQRDFEVC